MDSADLVSADNRPREIIDDRFAGIVGRRRHSWDQSAADGDGTIDMSVLRFETAAAFAGGDWFLPVVLRWSSGDCARVHDSDPCDEFGKTIATLKQRAEHRHTKVAATIGN